MLLAKVEEMQYDQLLMNDKGKSAFAISTYSLADSTSLETLLRMVGNVPILLISCLKR